VHVGINNIAVNRSKRERVISFRPVENSMGNRAHRPGCGKGAQRPRGWIRAGMPCRTMEPEKPGTEFGKWPCKCSLRAASRLSRRMSLIRKVVLKFARGSQPHEVRSY